MEDLDMGYERYSRDSNPGDYYNRGNDQDFGRDYGAGRDFSYSSARRYEAAGELGRNRGRDRDYGPREYGHSRYAQRDRFNDGRDYPDQGSGYRGSYAGDGQRFAERGSRRDLGDDRGFFERAGDEVRAWFGDDEAERRREQDARRDEARYGRDDDYHSWRRGQIEALDRDYDEYRRENRTRFESDSDAGGRHHSIPSRWIRSVDDKVTIAKTADEAHAHWRDEERNQALFGDDSQRGERDIGTTRNLNRSFSGTY
jgi:hypothetical protein